MSGRGEGFEDRPDDYRMNNSFYRAGKTKEPPTQIAGEAGTAIRYQRCRKAKVEDRMDGINSQNRQKKGNSETLREVLAAG